MHDYLEINRANWDSRVRHHLTGYDLDSFRSDPTFLSGVVRFDLPRLGDISKLDVIHLQCHIGTDTMSLARLGARSVTGLDFSPEAVRAARALAHELGHDIKYVASTVNEAPHVVGQHQFDLVYTGIGALCWLPRITEWATVVRQLLRPGGRLLVRDGHPMLYSIGDVTPDGTFRLAYSYVEDEGTLAHETTSYVPHEGELTAPESVSFNHGIGELLTALIQEGFVIDGFEEHDSVPWDALPGAMVHDQMGEFRLRDRPERLAASFTLRAHQRFESELLG